MAKPRIHPRTYKCVECDKEAIFRVSKLNLYCSQKCQNEYQYKLRVKEWLVKGKDWKGMIPNWVRRHLKEKHGDRCKVCGIAEHNSKPITFEVDHIDGNHANNTIKNLRLICPNCHSQTATYKNRNRGNGRTTRKVLQ